MNATAAQHSLNFDAPAAAQARDAAIECVESRANPEWRRLMIEIGEQVAERYATVTTDMIVQEYAKDDSRPKTNSMRAMSGVVSELKRKGVIEETGGYVNSKRISNHRCPIKLYRSLAYRGEA